jgi:hypothetical protein
MMINNVEQAHREIANYFQFVEKAISDSPLGTTDQTKAFRASVERSVAASFELSDKLLHAKDLKDVLRIQTDFFQTQLRALGPNNRKTSARRRFRCRMLLTCKLSDGKY